MIYPSLIRTDVINGRLIDRATVCARHKSLASPPLYHKRRNHGDEFLLQVEQCRGGCYGDASEAKVLVGQVIIALEWNLFSDRGFELLHYLVYRKTSRFLAWRIILERLQELAHELLCRG